MYFEFERKYLLIIVLSLVAVVSVTYFFAKHFTSRYDNILGRAKYSERFEMYNQ